MRTSITALLAAAVLGGCETLSYYAQAVGGHLELIGRARPVSEWLTDPHTAQALRKQLELARQLRDFASETLALPDNGSYRRYAELGRAYAVWNVFAAEEFSVAARESCFPVAGCVAYRGFFERADAERHAASLRERGLEVAILGVPAYSTLGAFDDPLLSSFIDWPEAELARLLFHELAHQVAYVRDDSTFNESFAVAVEREGVRRWLAAGARAAELPAYEESRQRQQRLTDRLGAARDRLRELYAASLPGEVKRERKRALLADLSADPQVRDLIARLGMPANNALLAAVATYSQKVPAFERMLARLGGDLPAFYAEVRALAGLDRPGRDARLSAYDSGMSTILR